MILTTFMLPPPIQTDDQRNQGDYQDNHNADHNTRQVILLPSGRRLRIRCLFFDNFFCFLIGDSLCHYKQSVGIHTDGSTGNQGTQIPLPLDLQLGSVMGENLVGIVHLIGKHFIQNVQIDHIPGIELREVCKHSLARHAGVSGKDRVGAFAANGHRAS